MKTGSIEFQANLPQQQGVQAFGPDPNRVAVIFSSGLQTNSSIAYHFNDNIQSISGLVFAGIGPPIVVTKDQIGDAICNPIYVFANAPGNVASATAFTLIP